MAASHKKLLANAFNHPLYQRYLDLSRTSTHADANLLLVEFLEHIVDWHSDPHVIIPASEGNGWRPETMALESKWTIAMGSSYQCNGLTMLIQVQVPCDVEDTYVTMTVLQFLFDGKKGTSWPKGLVIQPHDQAYKGMVYSLRQLQRYSFVLHYNGIYRSRLQAIVKAPCANAMRQTLIVKLYNLIQDGNGDSLEMMRTLEQIEAQSRDDQHVTLVNGATMNQGLMESIQPSITLGEKEREGQYGKTGAPPAVGEGSDLFIGAASPPTPSPREMETHVLKRKVQAMQRKLEDFQRDNKRLRSQVQHLETSLSATTGISSYDLVLDLVKANFIQDNEECFFESVCLGVIKFPCPVEVKYTFLAPPGDYSDKEPAMEAELAYDGLIVPALVYWVEKLGAEFRLALTPNGDVSYAVKLDKSDRKKILLYHRSQTDERRVLLRRPADDGVPGLSYGDLPPEEARGPLPAGVQALSEGGEEIEKEKALSS